MAEHRGPPQISCVVDKYIAPKRKVKVRIYDTINLVSAVKKSLEELSKSVDVKFPNEKLRKLKLPDGTITDMLKYRKQDLSSFCEYGLQDAKIPVFYSQVIRNIVSEILGTNDVKKWSVSRNFFETFKLPLTTTSIGARFIKDKVWENKDFEFYERECIDQINNDYGKTYQRESKSRTKLPWLNLLGYHTTRVFKYNEEVDADGKTQYIRDKKPELTF